MAKLILKAAPTFKAKVGIPVAGGEPVPVEFTFKHRTKSALDEFIKSRADQSDAESLLAMAEAWDLDDEFNQESIELLLENYIGSALAVYRTYIDQLMQAKVKN
ncbi:phage tail assembly chaperone [Collimonas fungivorans]|nr:phage tail assembly chaperone [Collimonas fungivorans]